MLFSYLLIFVQWKLVHIWFEKTRGHTHKNLILNYVCHIHLFDPCILHVAKEEQTSTLIYRVGGKSWTWNWYGIYNLTLNFHVYDLVYETSYVPIFIVRKWVSMRITLYQAKGPHTTSLHIILTICSFQPLFFFREYIIYKI